MMVMVLADRPFTPVDIKEPMKMEIEALRPFSEKGINLKKIESRPVKNGAWEYVFFLDFEGQPRTRRFVRSWPNWSRASFS